MSSLLAERDTVSGTRIEYPPIIGLSGFARSGKDTVGRLLGAYGYAPLSLADPIREALQIIDPMVLAQGRQEYGLAEYIEEYGWEEAKDRNPRVRPLMQRTGDAMKKVVGEDVWIRAALSKMVPGKSYVITDVRFDLEAEVLREAGAVIVRIDRPGYGKQTDHRSDRVISPHLVDAILRNDGTAVELPAEIAYVMDGLSVWHGR